MSPRLHVLDRVCEGRCPHVGTLVRYADHFVVMCDTKAHIEESRQRVGTVLTRLRLELNPEKTMTGRPLTRMRGVCFLWVSPAQARGVASGRWSSGSVDCPFFRALGSFALRGTIRYPEMVHART
jgi:hypothetical protein